MKILVVHNRYRLRGGEDSVFEAECRMLEKAGHVVVRYERNNDEIPSGVFGKAATALGTVWSRRAYREVREILRRERPDAMHCHNTFPLVSPSVYYAAAAERVPVVQTLHNFRLACLNGYLYRDREICEKCLGRVPWRGVARKCYRDSLSGSLAVAAMLVVHRALGTWRRKVTRYVALTEFAKRKFVEAGLPAGKIVVKPNVHDGAPPEPSDARPGKGLTFLYLGRLSPEKGVDVLVDAWRIFCGSAAFAGADPPPRLLVAGDGPERAALEAQAAGLPGISFLGAVPARDVPALLRGCSAAVLPSRCHEQFSVSSMECLSTGRPMLVSDAARTGTLVADGESGFVFRSGGASSLAQKLSEACDASRLEEMSRAARRAFDESDCPEKKNLGVLENIYRNVHEKHA